MSLRLPRWIALLLLPLLGGAVLLMHGLEAGAGDATSHGTVTGAHPHPHEDHGCDGCAAGHLMAACVAVVTTIATVHAGRRVLSGRRITARLVAAPGRVRALGALLRPPEPAWVRLAVMRC